MHYLLFYDVVPDYVERRAAFRDEHLSLAWEAHARGELVLGGALDDPVDGAVLLFSGDSPAAAEAFAAPRPLRPQRPRHALAGADVEDGDWRGCRHSRPPFAVRRRRLIWGSDRGQTEPDGSKRTQGIEWRDPRRASGGDIAGGNRHDHQERGNQHKRQRVNRTDVE